MSNTKKIQSYLLKNTINTDLAPTYFISDANIYPVYSILEQRGSCTIIILCKVKVPANKDIWRSF